MDDNRLARRIVDRGFAPADQVQECLKRSAGRDFGAELVRLGLVTAAQLASLRQESPPAARPPTSRATKSVDVTRTTGIAEETGGLPPEVASRIGDPDYCFQKFVLVEELGKGGMGVVWKAWQRDLKRWVAIKFLQSEDDEELRRFLREAQTAARLSHPNIAAVYDLGEEAGRVYIVMEFVDGSSLHQLGKLEPARAMEILRDAALALHHAHQEGVIHRDIKPHNIMVNRKGRTYVMDFGLAKAVRGGDGMTIPGMIMGTPSYMPPEQAEGRTQHIDRRSDVYSLGATLHAALTGKPPFPGRSPVDIMYKVVHSPPPALPAGEPGLSTDLDKVCQRAMSKRREARYPDSKQFAADLDKVLRGEPLGPGATRRPFLRTPAGIGAVVLMLALPVAIFAAFANRKEPEGPRPTAPASAGADILRRADALATAGKVLESMELLNTVASGDPVRPEADARLGLLLLERVELFRYDVRDPALLGGDESPRGRTERAAARKHLAAAPDRPEILCARALADRRFDEALRLCPAEPAPPALRTWCLLRTLKTGETLKSLPGGDLRSLTWRLLAAQNTYDIPAAKAALDELLALRPDEPMFRRHRGILALRQKDYPAAVEEFGRLAERYPNDPRYPVDRAWARIGANEWDKAAEEAEQLVRRWPEDPDPHWILGMARVAQLKHAEAIDSFDRALLLNPAHYSARLNRGAAKYGLKQYVKAAEDYTEAAKAEPADPGPLFNRAICWIQASQLDRAAEDLKLASGMTPRNPDSWRQFMEAAIKLKRHDLVLAFTSRFVGSNPGIRDLLYWHGSALIETGRPADGLRFLEEFLRTRPDANDSVLNYLGVGHYRLGEYAKAEVAFTRAMALNPKSTQYPQNRGLCREHTGNLEGAIEDMELVLRLGPPDPEAVRQHLESLKKKLGR